MLESCISIYICHRRWRAHSHTSRCEQSQCHQSTFVSCVNNNKRMYIQCDAMLLLRCPVIPRVYNADARTHSQPKQKFNECVSSLRLNYHWAHTRPHKSEPMYVYALFVHWHRRTACRLRWLVYIVCRVVSLDSARAHIHSQYYEYEQSLRLLHSKEAYRVSDMPTNSHRCTIIHSIFRNFGDYPLHLRTRLHIRLPYARNEREMLSCQFSLNGKRSENYRCRAPGSVRPFSRLVSFIWFDDFKGLLSRTAVILIRARSGHFRSLFD